LKHFLSNERDRARAQKRGGGIAALSLDNVVQDGERRFSVEPRSELTPEKMFERQWALAVLDRVTLRLQAEFAESGKSEQFERMRPFLIGAEDEIPYKVPADELATRFHILSSRPTRFRKRFAI
jgi:RNA polymerase sigma-70 factor (ECF subfamily)